MDNEYKVSWIDTNPQNSSMAEQYVFKKHNGKRQEKDRKKKKQQKICMKNLCKTENLYF